MPSSIVLQQPTRTSAATHATAGPTITRGAHAAASSSRARSARATLGATSGRSTARTNLYTSYGKLDRKPHGAIDRTVFNVGARHRF